MNYCALVIEGNVKFNLLLDIFAVYTEVKVAEEDPNIVGTVAPS